MNINEITTANKINYFITINEKRNIDDIKLCNNLLQKDLRVYQIGENISKFYMTVKI